MYQALYRKYRPQTFADVSGQTHVTRTLTHELEEGKLSHAYLFTGSRGTGKTTCAKILSKAVNCLSPVNGNPCNECEICRGIDGGSVLDVIEIDAASNNGVDNIRDLREEANFTPVKAKYRVYIIDEVHMLTIGAFNALLKILEEPPSYVIFILATTEVHKLPATILSRCQRFDFKHIDPSDISERLKYVASCEGVSITDDAAMLISRISDGALRDALSLLDRCSANGTEITSEIVGDCAGIAGREYLFKMADCVKNRDISSALNLVSELHNESCNMDRLCTELINHFRNLMISKTVKNPENLIICSKTELSELYEQSKGFTLKNILDFLSILEDTSLNLKKGLDRRVEVEMAVIKLCSVSAEAAPQKTTPPVSVPEPAQIKTFSSPIISSVPAPIPEVAPPPPNELLPQPEPLFETQAVDEKPTIFQKTEAPTPEDKQSGEKSDLSAFRQWPEVLDILAVSSKPMHGVLLNSFAYEKENILYIKCGNAAFSQFLHIPLYYSAIENAVEKITGKKYKVEYYEEEKKQKNNPLSDLIKKIDSLN